MKVLLLGILLSTQLFASQVQQVDQKLRGQAEFSWLFFDVYTAKLWAMTGSDIFRSSLSLELIYKRDFSGIDISKRSFSELLKQGHSKKYVKKWEAHVYKIFPDIKKGDSILANFTPESGLVFYLNRSRKLGTIKDQKFAIDFLKIWLGEKTTEPKLRESLLGSGGV